VSVHPISSEDQPADMLTKSLSAAMLIKHCKRMMGWWPIFMVGVAAVKCERECDECDVKLVADCLSLESSMTHLLRISPFTTLLPQRETVIVVTLETHWKGNLFDPQWVILSVT